MKAPTSVPGQQVAVGWTVCVVVEVTVTVLQMVAVEVRSVVAVRETVSSSVAMAIAVIGTKTVLATL